MAEHNILKMKLNELYPLYIAKAERKGKAAAEVNEIICWLTGYSADELSTKLNSSDDLEGFLSSAPTPNPNRVLITGSICGVKLAEIEDPIMKELRYLDKLVDELAKGKAMEKILRK